MEQQEKKTYKEKLKGKTITFNTNKVMVKSMVIGKWSMVK